MQLILNVYLENLSMVALLPTNEGAGPGMWIFSFLGWCSFTLLKWLFLPPLKCAKQWPEGDGKCWSTLLKGYRNARVFPGMWPICRVHFLNESDTHANVSFTLCIKYRTSYTATHMQILEVVLFSSQCFLCTFQSTHENPCGNSMENLSILMWNFQTAHSILEDVLLTSVLPQVTRKVLLFKDSPTLEHMPKYRS